MPTALYTIMYRIAWKNHVTGLTGHGEFIFDNENKAMRVASDMNLHFDQNRQLPCVGHWVESNEDELREKHGLLPRM